MDVTMSSSPPSRTVDAKRRAIGRYHAVSYLTHSMQKTDVDYFPHKNTQQRGTTAALGLDEAMELEQKANAAALERQKQDIERRLQRGLPLPGELTREEREARMWAFM